MNYDETLAYLYSQLPLFSRIGAAAYKEDITNTVKLCEAIGNPQDKIKTVHIAGTNGKGSTSHMLASILQECGYKTGLYTSPHLRDFRERIKINGQMISKKFITDFVAGIRPVSELIQPSFFELSVAMALQYFYEEAVDIAIIETGLGGRLDSTNIILPELAIITNIGYDHMNILGNTLEKIAYEKAGIIKPAVPVIMGETLPETIRVFINQAAIKNAPIRFAEKTFGVLAVNLTHEELDVTVEELDTGKQLNYSLDLNGIYQQKNLCTVLTAATELRKLGFLLEEEKVKKALSRVKLTTGLYGRWDVLQKHPMVVLDVAHNADGIKQLLLQISLCTYDKLHIVIGIVKDKDIESILVLLPKDATYYFTRAHIPRATPEEELQEKARQHQLTGERYSDVNIALSDALKNATSVDLIIICGSVFLVGEVRETGNYKDP